MKEKDYIKDLFADKLANAQAPVSPELWSAISSKIGTSSVVSTGLSTAAKWMLGLGTAASITVATILFVNYNDDKESHKEQNKVLLSDKENSTAVSNPEDKSIKAETSFEVIKEDKIKFITPQVSDEYDNIVYGIDFEEEVLVGSKIGDVSSDEIIFKDNSSSSITSVNSNSEVDKKDQLIENHAKPSQAEDLYVGELTNTFTLNNDGINDYFIIQLKGISDFVITVLNDKNEVVFKSNDISFKWDGRDLKGELVAKGQYVYFFTGKDSLGNPVTKYQTLRIN